MSLEALTKIVERAATDEAFRAQLKRDGDAALRGYDLTPEEHAALLSGDSTRLESLGVDARITKQAAVYVDQASPGSFAPGQPG